MVCVKFQGQNGSCLWLLWVSCSSSDGSLTVAVVSCISPFCMVAIEISSIDTRGAEHCTLCGQTCLWRFYSNWWWWYLMPSRLAIPVQHSETNAHSISCLTKVSKPWCLLNWSLVYWVIICFPLHFLTVALFVYLYDGSAKTFDIQLQFCSILAFEVNYSLLWKERWAGLGAWTPSLGPILGSLCIHIVDRHYINM